MTTTMPRLAKPAPSTRSWVGQTTERIGDYWTLGVLLILVIVFSLLNGNFFSQGSWLATSVYASSLLALGIGQLYVIISAGIDLSVGAVTSVSAISSGLIMTKLFGEGAGEVTSIAAGIVVGLLVGATVGLINGLVITRLKLPPFIATLWLQGVGTGAALLLNNGEPVYGLPPEVQKIGSKNFFGGWLPFPVLIVAVAAVIMAVILTQTRFGRHVFSVGGNTEASRRAGIKVAGTLVWVYVLSGLMAALAGLLLMGQFGISHPNFGAASLLTSVAAVVIGGGSLFGGRGTVLGTVFGTAIIAVLVTGLVLANVQSYWQQVAVGVVIVIAVWIDQLRAFLRQR